LVWANSNELTAWLEALPSDVRAEVVPDREVDLATAPLAPAAREVADAARGRRRWLPGVFAVALAMLAVTGITFWKIAERRASTPKAGGSTPYDDHPEAREMFMTARFELATRTADSLAAAERDFRRLVELYPQRAAGWSGLADTYLLLREYGSMAEETAYPKAAEAARAALAADPKLADAWLDQAFVAYWWQDDTQAAFRAFETALELDPTSAKAFHWYGTALMGHGDFAKALEMLARARALDPGNRAIVADEGWLRFSAGQREEGLATLERLVKIDPKFLSWHAYLARAYLVESRDADFLREALMAAELRGRTDITTRLQLAAQRFQAGGRAAMLDQLTASEAEAWKAGAGSAVLVAEYRALANDAAGLYSWLTIAEAQHDHNLSRLRSDPEFSAFLADPRFIAVAQRLP